MNARREWVDDEAREGRKLTVVLIPGDGRLQYQWRFSVWVLALLGLAALFLMASAAFVVGRDWKLRGQLDRSAELQQENLRVAMDLAQGRDALLRVALLEGRLRELLDYKTKKALLKAQPTPAGPDEEDVLHLAQDLERDPENADGDVRPGVTALVQAARDREHSVQQVLDYVQDKRTRLDSKPSGWPVHGWISSGFGKRVDPVSGRAGFHAGVDIANDTGTPVRCTADGRVAFAGWDGGYGKLVIVEHGSGFRTYYGHLSQIKTAAGVRMHKGTIVGLMGATGYTTGPHVHYEIRLFGVPVNSPQVHADGSVTVRTRFAPSPTGTLHIGGARTALFNWLFARRHGGTFVLRMEDTDLARSTRESVDQVLRDLRWLGLTWDEGPAADNRASVGPHGSYFQSQRLGIYVTYLEKLKAAGLAYPSFESKAEVEAEREAALAEGRAPSGAFDEASPEQVQAMLDKGMKPAWRFRVPENGVTEFLDLVHGPMRFENRLMADFVIVRSDGMPTYNFAAVVDDALMDITHVLRGDDHLSNTPRQVCLYRALGLKEPAFAHIPMILGPDKQRLSKRHGATAVGEYETMGFLPETLLNYLALLGWSLDDKTTLISVPELVAAFSLERVTKHAAVFDPVKLAWMNSHYVRQGEDARLAPLIKDQFLRAGLTHDGEAWWLKLAHALKEKARILSELPAENSFFFRREEPQAEARQRFLDAGGPALAPRLLTLLDGVVFEAAALEAALRAFCAEGAPKFKDAVAVLRCAVSGRTVTPGLFETLELLGKEECAARVRAAGGWA